MLSRPTPIRPAATCVAVLPAGPLAAPAHCDCDRTCLNRVADGCFAAMAAHDGARAPITSNALLTEQTQVNSIGERLWKTVPEIPTTVGIYEIEATGFTLPLNSSNGWHDFLR